MSNEPFPFVNFLNAQRNGCLVDELALELKSVIDEVQRTGKDGALTLTLKIKTASDNQVFVTDEIKPKIPQAPKGASLFYVSERGLSRNDPRQMLFDMGDEDMREVEESKKNLERSR